VAANVPTSELTDPTALQTVLLNSVRRDGADVGGFSTGDAEVPATSS
jgi:hypothetical protein